MKLYASANVLKVVSVSRMLVRFLPPAKVVAEGNVFTSVCQEFCPGGVSQHAMGRRVPQGRHPPRQTPAPLRDGH